MAIAAQTQLTGSGVGEHSFGYRAMLQQLNANFVKNTKSADVLFSVTKDKSSLWSIYLNSFPLADRQHYNCNECRKFFERYADIVTVDAKGKLTSVMFSESPQGEYAYIFDRLRAAIEGASIEHVFATEETKWGIPVTGPWEHFAVKPAKKLVHQVVLDADRKPIETAYQYEAKFTALFNTMVRALVEYSVEDVKQALTIINGNALFRGEAVKGPAEWLLKVLTDQKKTKNAVARHNMLWREVVLAPVGFARPRGTKIGTLLDDIVEKKDIAEIRANFAHVMDPTKHAQPQKAPSAANIKQAERLVSSMNLESALRRRFATLDDVQKMWVPRTVAQGGTGGVFGHLTPRDRKTQEATLMNLPAKKMTMEKFVTQVLPTARDIEVRMTDQMPFVALVTAEDPSARPILQWDDAKKRNPVSWYVYPKGSSAAQWGARSGTFVKVNAVTAGPSQWNSRIKLPQHGEQVMFLLDGVKDSQGEKVGLALLPEFLISELHPVRKTIHEHSHSGTLKGLSKANACGVTYNKATGGSLFLRVKTNDVIQSIEIDRWD